MAKASVVWTTDFHDFEQVATTALDLEILETEVLDQNVGYYTLRRLVLTFACRVGAVTDTPGWFHFGIAPLLVASDAADFAANDFTGELGPRWIWKEHIPLTGLAMDSTTVADQRPLTVLKIDTRVMRKIGRGRYPKMVLYNEHAIAVDYSYHADMLWSRTKE